MTKQIVVVPESAMDISMAAKMAVCDHPPAASSGTAAAAGWTKLLKKLETGGGVMVNINACTVDAMEASSPSHTNSTPPSIDSCWIVRCFSVPHDDHKNMNKNGLSSLTVLV